MKRLGLLILIAIFAFVCVTVAARVDLVTPDELTADMTYGGVDRTIEMELVSIHSPPAFTCGVVYNILPPILLVNVHDPLTLSYDATGCFRRGTHLTDQLKCPICSAGLTMVLVYTDDRLSLI